MKNRHGVDITKYQDDLKSISNRIMLLSHDELHSALFVLLSRVEQDAKDEDAKRNKRV